MSKRIYLNMPCKTACGHYRAVLPHRHCSPILAEENIILDCPPDLNIELDYDVFIFHRIINPQFLPYILKLKEQGKKIIWELDDDLFNIPAWNPARNQITAPLIECLKLVLDWSDEIIVSTDHLKEALGFQYKTTVLPNLIDQNDWPRVRYSEPDSTTRILWAGSDTHHADLEEVVPALNRLAEGNPKVHLIFAGMVPESLRDLSNTTFLPMVPLENYADLVQLVRPHIALCPLATHKFNDCKSPIKWFEMTQCGAAVIASGGSPYGRVMDDGRHGYLTYIQEDWYPRLLYLINNERDRYAFWEESLRGVHERHSWQGKNKQVWLDWFRKVVSE